jgi:hypothetical protein
MRIAYCLLLTLALVPWMTAVSQSAPIVGGTATYEYVNTFTTRLFPGTPFNPGTEAVDVPVIGVSLRFRNRRESASLG